MVTLGAAGKQLMGGRGSWIPLAPPRPPGPCFMKGQIHCGGVKGIACSCDGAEQDLPPWLWPGWGGSGSILILPSSLTGGEMGLGGGWWDLEAAAGGEETLGWDPEGSAISVEG